jgi:hypothetical protein
MQGQTLRSVLRALGDIWQQVGIADDNGRTLNLNGFRRQFHTTLGDADASGHRVHWLDGYAQLSSGQVSKEEPAVAIRRRDCRTGRDLHAGHRN